MKYLLIILLTVVFSSTAFSQSEVKIGNQIWMSKNLDVDTFRNGKSIPHATCEEEWEFSRLYKIPAWCYYEFDEVNRKKYGVLYNWFAVIDPRGLAPVGYHVPSDEEWSLLVNQLGGADIAGTKMKSRTGWSNNGNGDNSSGLNFLPGGYYLGGWNFGLIGMVGYWWSSTECDINNAWFRDLYYHGSEVRRIDDLKYYGFTIRCLRD